MDVCVIGGTGHIGRHLVAALVADGCDVTVVTSGRTPIPKDGAWDGVRAVSCAYKRGDPKWASCLCELAPQVLVDIIGTDVPGTYAAVKPFCQHLIACGSVWMFGPPRVVPTPEHTQGPCRFEGYARRYQELHDVRTTAARDGMAFTAIMPPNICGPGKIPLDGLGGRDVKVHRAHARGEPVALPRPGQTLIGPCDAEDVARGFFLAIQHRRRAADQIFNVGSAYALTTQQFIETYSGIHGVRIPIEWCSWKTFAQEICPDLGAHYHFEVNMCPDLGKIRSLLGYAPSYTPEETMARAVAWMRNEQML